MNVFYKYVEFHVREMINQGDILVRKNKNKKNYFQVTDFLNSLIVNPCSYYLYFLKANSVGYLMIQWKTSIKEKTK